MLRIKSADGQEIASLDDWLKHGGPRGMEAQWVDGRSAKELAKAWLGPRPPEAFLALMESHPRTRGFVPEWAIPELKIPFDAYPAPRVADLQLFGRAAGGSLSISIEGKADEAFGEDTVGEYRAKALATNPRTGVPARIDGLCRALLGESYAESLAPLRYQLFHAAAAALVRARADGASAALFLVHEFVSSKTKVEKRLRNDQDFRAFFARLGKVEASTLSSGRVHGPFAVPGGGRIPGDVPLFVAKISVPVAG